MDRNVSLRSLAILAMVALRKESVDRNKKVLTSMYTYGMSLSARRAWIEIIDYIIDYVNDASLSARRAWIEIVNSLSMLCSAGSRSPQGERG